MYETSYSTLDGSRQFENLSRMMRQIMADQSEIKDQLRSLTLWSNVY